jgi:hypothetical protein
MRRGLFGLLLVGALFAGAGMAALTSGGKAGPAGTPSATRLAVVGGSGSPSGGPSAFAPGPTSSVDATPSATPEPSVSPSPSPPVSPLTGLPVSAALASRHPIAVMVDDQFYARPQSGFNQAGVVWQAPAEGGIPRYMMIFLDGNPAAVGPVRSSRLYFVQWAAEWRAVYAHAGGSPQAMATLRKYGKGQLVYNAEDFRWEGTYFWRIKTRSSPHNLYTDGAHLRTLAKRLGAKAVTPRTAWTFGPDAPLDARPTGGRIDVAYKENSISYRYDRATNTYKRYVGGAAQVDAADKKPVAPRNVVVMLVKFGPLNDGHPQKGRLEAANIGKGTAWISTNGLTIKGTWRKANAKDPTRFYDAKGNPVTLTAGQTFIEVLDPKTCTEKFTPGKPAASAAPSASPAPSAAP